MPSALKPNHMFLGSFVNLPFSFSSILSIFLHCDPSAGCLKFLSFLQSSLCHCNNLACSLFPNKTFQPWYYRSIPHHLGSNPLPGALALNITRVISSDLIAQ